MCACRCGINVHLKDGKVAYIEGNKDHPVNQGVLCAKGSAGIMQVNAPSRLDAPLMRVGPRGSGEFKKIYLGRSVGFGSQMVKTPQKGSTRETSILYRSRSVAILHKLLRPNVWHTKLCSTWWILQRKHGHRRNIHNGWCILGIWPTRLGLYKNYLFFSGLQRTTIVTLLKWVLGKLKKEALKLLA